MAYFDGSTVTLTATFTVDGTPTDPDTIILTLQAPDGTDTVYDEGDCSNPVTGTWTKVVVLDQPGVWQIRWEGTGDAAGVQQTSIRVRPSNV